MKKLDNIDKMFDRRNDCNIDCLSPELDGQLTLTIHCKNPDTGMEHTEKVPIDLDVLQQENLRESLRRIDFIMTRPRLDRQKWDPYKAVTFKLHE